ncbi:hypothetical protein FACS1894130_13380 [Spirochaetia bacterium]|nr:hypothetical protein FACS1894130_13380 [Spirochaetia bacterium]
MRSRSPQSRYYELVRQQRKKLQEYAAHEIEWADDLLTWYRAKKIEIPDDEYRGVAFFKNREYIQKPGSLTLCYTLYQQMIAELPQPTKETAFYLVGFRYKMYAAVLEKGGY